MVTAINQCANGLLHSSGRTLVVGSRWVARRLSVVNGCLTTSNKNNATGCQKLLRKRQHQRAAFGFTLIEILVVLTLIGIIASLAAPSLKDFLMRNTATSLSNGLYAGISQARIEAITRNTCVSMCQSTSTQSAISGGALSCVTTGADWLRGWVIVTNPTCDSADDNPVGLPNAVVIKVTQPHAGSEFTTENAAGGTIRRNIMFDSRGLLQGVTNTANLTLGPVNANEPDKFRRQICISSGGRVTVRAYAGGAC